MSQDDSIDKIEVAFFCIAIIMMLVAVLYFLGFQIPGVLLLIIGISAIIIGVLKIISVFYTGI